MNIHHMALYVQDLEGARDFFVNYFNARANELYHNPVTGFSSYFIAFDSGARIELCHKEGKTPPRENMLGYSHLALSVGSREAVDQLTDIFARAGYPALSGPRLTGDGYYESCISAFEGNVIEIVE